MSSSWQHKNRERYSQEAILQLEAVDDDDLMLRAVRKGATTNAGILAAIKSVWKGASTLALVPPAPAIPIPSRDEMRLPAQVGHPTNRPLVAPIPAARDVFV